MRGMGFTSSTAVTLQGKEFMWDDSYELTPAEMREVERMLLQYYQIDPKYFEEEYSIPILGARNDGFFG